MILDHGRCGWLVPVRNDAALDAAIGEVLDGSGGAPHAASGRPLSQLRVDAAAKEYLKVLYPEQATCPGLFDDRLVDAGPAPARA